MLASGIMALYRCPHPSHGEHEVTLKSNNDKVYECQESHRFYRKGEGAALLLVDLISGQGFVPAEMKGDGEPEKPRPRLKFMTDVPRVLGAPDFNALSLPAAAWKLLSKVDGKTTLEEVRLLAGLKADETESLVFRLIDDGLIELRGKK